MNRIGFLLTYIIVILGACTSRAVLVKDGDIYLYQGKEQIVVSFKKEPDSEILVKTVRYISFLVSKLPEKLAEEDVSIEGLTGDPFSDFYTIGDTLFFSIPFYHNKMLIYGYLASLYQEFHKKDDYAFVPMRDFQNLLKDQKLSPQETMLLYNASVDYAVEATFFVSLLELLERQQRYFYPQKTEEELFRVLIYPEILGFWEEMAFRFGTQMMLETAQKVYTPESWHVIFGEEVNQLEANYVKATKKAKEQSVLLSDQILYQNLTNSLFLYMTGTKKSLMLD